MNCDTCGEWLDEYLEASLSAEVRAEVDQHLVSCSVCREELESCRRLKENLAKVPRHTPGAEVCMRVSKVIHAEAPNPRRTDFGPVLDFDELAEYLRVDKTVLGQYLAEIPCFELGGRLLFRKAKVEAWIEKRETTVVFPTERPPVMDSNGWANSKKGEQSWTLIQTN